MAIEVEKPSEVTQIPIAPGIKLENLIQFDGDCIDPIALIIITEALDYALETSVRRLRSAGRIFSGVEESAYSGGKGVLPVIRAVREAILMAPQCTPRVKAISKPSPPEEVIATQAKRRTKEMQKPSVEELKKMEEAVSGAKTTEELLQIVKGHPELEKAIQGVPKKIKPSKPTPEAVKSRAAQKKERGQPELWGAATFTGTGKEVKLSGEYESPGALAKALKIQTRGAKDMNIAFRRAGFEVRGDGEKAEKGKTKFLVRRVGVTPREYRLVEEPEFGEYEGPGRLAL